MFYCIQLIIIYMFNIFSDVGLFTLVGVRKGFWTISDQIPWGAGGQVGRTGIYTLGSGKVFGQFQIKSHRVRAGRPGGRAYI